MSSQPNLDAGAGADRARRWSVATSVGSIFTAMAASVCCVGPLVFALLGLGGAGLLLELEPYRPYFTALTFGLLGFGFYFTYRRPKGRVTSGTECDCPTPKANRGAKIILWIATLLSIAFLASAQLVPVLFG